MADLSVRLQLAAVWTALMFLFVYADLLSFFRPGELAEIPDP
jgi:cbb3-type cytochrome oxidase subunit 3